MIVCVCKNVNDKKIRELKAKNLNLKDIVRETKAAQQCGKCFCTVKKLLEE